MFELILINFLLVEFLLALIGKFNLIDKFKKLAAKGNSKTIYDLSNCFFCIHFHLTWIVFIAIIFLFKFELSFILVPFCVSGLKKVINAN